MALFKPGQSGNPGGRPKGNVVQALARTYTKEAIETLVSIMRSKKAPAAARAAASNAILDRGYGRPAQSLEVGINKSFDDMSDDDLLAIAAGASDDEESQTTTH